MKIYRFKKVEKFLATAILFSLFTPVLNAQTSSRFSKNQENETAQDIFGSVYETAKEQVEGDSKIAPDLIETLNRRDAAGITPQSIEEKIKVIIKYREQPTDKFGSNSADSPNYSQKMREFKGNLLKNNKQVGLISAEMAISEIENLSKDENIEYISPDRETQAAGHLEKTTGATLVRSILGTTATGATTNLDGRGIGVAVIDSGIHSYQDSIVRWASPTNNTTGYTSPVVYQKDFLGTYPSGSSGNRRGLECLFNRSIRTRNAHCFDDCRQ